MSRETIKDRRFTWTQPINTECMNCGSCDHVDYQCPCACHEAWTNGQRGIIHRPGTGLESAKCTLVRFNPANSRGGPYLVVKLSTTVGTLPRGHRLTLKAHEFQKVKR